MALSREDLIKEIGGMTVLELSELVKELENEFGVSAAMPAAAPAAGGAQEQAGEAAAEEEKSEYKVELTEGGSEKIKTIKALRQ